MIDDNDNTGVGRFIRGGGTITRDARKEGRTARVGWDQGLILLLWN